MPLASGFGSIPVCAPTPAVPLPIAGLSRSASEGSIGEESGRDALARVGRAGSFLECFAGLRGGFLGDFGIRPIWAWHRGEGRAVAFTGEMPTIARE